MENYQIVPTEEYICGSQKIYLMIEYSSGHCSFDDIDNRSEFALVHLDDVDRIMDALSTCASIPNFTALKMESYDPKLKGYRVTKIKDIKVLETIVQNLENMKSGKSAEPVRTLDK